MCVRECGRCKEAAVCRGLTSDETLSSSQWQARHSPVRLGMQSTCLGEEGEREEGEIERKIEHEIIQPHETHKDGHLYIS